MATKKAGDKPAAEVKPLRQRVTATGLAPVEVVQEQSNEDANRGQDLANARQSRDLTELEQLELEERKLRLENLRYQVENERQRRAEIIRKHAQNQKTIDDVNRDIIAKQSVCNHKKGGKGLPGLVKGNDNDYSVIKHTYPWGETAVMCTRCMKEWRRPKAHLAKEDPKAFAKQMETYNEALAFQTDNEPSGSRSIPTACSRIMLAY
jgi:hypothetical protein